jgi:hypothetical protein
VKNARERKAPRPAFSSDFDASLDLHAGNARI